MKKQLSGYIETAKTVVMILLFACVLCLLAVYIAQKFITKKLLKL